MHFTHSNQTFHHIRCFFRVGLGGNALVAFACGTWLVGVDTWNNDQLVLYILLNRSQAADIVTYRVSIVCGTRSDDDKKTVIFSANDIADLLISFLLKSL